MKAGRNHLETTKMKRSFETAAKYENGKLIFDKDLYRQQLREITKGKDKPVTLKTSVTVDSKTVNQNNFFHLLIDFLYKHLISEGHQTFQMGKYYLTLNPENTKEFLYRELGIQRIEGGGFINVRCSNASKMEMSVVIEAMIEFIEREFEIKCPRPLK